MKSERRGRERKQSRSSGEGTERRELNMDISVAANVFCYLCCLYVHDG